MNKGTLALISGLTLGGAAMYFLDPDRGKRRRALVRDKMSSSARVTGDTFGKTSRDVAHRTSGLIAETRSLLSHAGGHNGDVLTERIRSKLGRVVRHPGSIMVQAEKGHVTLSGPVLKSEVQRLLSAVASVKGVKEVENRLDIHEMAKDIPGPQGEAHPLGGRFEFFQRNWSPAARLLAGAAGLGLAIHGLRRRGMLGSALGTAGLGLLTRGITNLETKQLVGLGAGRGAIEIQKAINIGAPVERVFEVWSNYENFPYFMSNVREVRRTSATMSHWKVAGPAGAPIEWDAVVTEFVPNEVLAWKTTPGAPVAHAGRVHFSRNPSGSTRVDIKLSYNPVAGGLGHVVASLFRSDPKTEMDQDLVRMKSFIETGEIPSGAAALEHRR